MEALASENLHAALDRCCADDVTAPLDMAYRRILKQQGPRDALLAARLLAEHSDQQREAAQRLQELVPAWTEHPLHPPLVAMASQLSGNPARG